MDGWRAESRIEVLGILISEQFPEHPKCKRENKTNVKTPKQNLISREIIFQK